MGNTVYVLGAGASLEETKSLPLPMPLATQFFDPRYLSQFPAEYDSLTKGFERIRKSRLPELLNRFYNIDISNSGIVTENPASVNIEDIASFFYTLATGQPFSIVDTHRSRDVYELLLDYIRHIILSISWDMTVCPNMDTFYHRLCKSLAKDDSIITFNWDCLLDRALQDFDSLHLHNLQTILNPIIDNSHYSIRAHSLTPLERKSSTQFLKLHGSLNWLVCENKSCHRSSYPLTGSLQNSAEAIEKALLCDHCGGQMTWSMMPPIQFKDYSRDRIYQSQLSIAKEVLQQAERVIIIGFSFSAFDLKTQHLFRSAIQNEVVWEPTEFIIVNPEVRKRHFRKYVRNILGSRIFFNGEPWSNSFRWFETVADFNSHLVPPIAPIDQYDKRIYGSWRIPAH